MQTSGAWTQTLPSRCDFPYSSVRQLDVLCSGVAKCAPRERGQSRVVILGGVVFVPVLAGLLAGCAGDFQPVQPLAFSHTVHAGEFKIPCLYCHSYARRSPVAGVPSMQRCMGCHNWIQSDHPEIAKLKEYWDREEPIPWIRVYSTPISSISITSGTCAPGLSAKPAMGRSRPWSRSAA